jgi:hypothetical protein
MPAKSTPIEQRLDALEERNRNVEANKAWETSWVRRLTIAFITYACAAFYMRLMGLEPAFVGACVPVGGYLLSTFSLPWLKVWWQGRRG